MEIIDIHTHHLDNPFSSIINVYPKDFKPVEGAFYSMGIHPWHISNESGEDWDTLKKLCHYSQVIAIGEIGLDKLSNVPFELQKEYFIRQLSLACEVNKPIILHVVRSIDEIMAIKKDYPQLLYIIHGFRGKKEQACQLIQNGFYLSFGEKYQEEAVKVVPMDRLFLETDEGKQPIEKTYSDIADLLSVSPEQLKIQIQRNIDKVFFRR